MNKEKFIKELEKKLGVLSQEEKKDIINEYSDIISEKMKHGKTEEEAVKEFGDIDSLTKDILESYKINPEYKKNDLLGDCEDLIKKGAKKLSEVTDEVVDNIKKNDNEISVELVFEIIIKVFLLLLAFAVIRLPFHVVGSLGESLFASTSFFFGHGIAHIIWRVLVEVVYILVCIMLALAVINKYTKKNDTKVAKTEQQKKPVKDTKEEKSAKASTAKKETMSEEKKESKVVEKVEKPKKQPDHTLSNLILIIIKVWCCIIFIFPLLACQFSFVVAICAVVYLMVKGVELYAILILLIGLIIFVGHIIKILFDALFTTKRIHFMPLIIGFILITLGGIFTIDYFLSFTYYNTVKDSDYKFTDSEYTETIDGVTHIAYDNLYIDEEVEDNNVKIIVTYYDELNRLTKKVSTKNVCHADTCKDEKTIKFILDDKESFNFNKIMDTTFIKDIKARKMYDYSELSEIKVNVYVNEDTSSLIVNN